MTKRHPNNRRALAAVFGTMLLIMIVLIPASALFMTIYSYHESSKGAIQTEQEKMQEQIELAGLVTRNESGTDYISELYVNNTGAITSRIRAIYVDNVFWFDPATAIGPDQATVNPQQILKIQIPDPPFPQQAYSPDLKITVATERGYKTIETGRNIVPIRKTINETFRYYFGPLLLNFSAFYFTGATPEGTYDPSSWKEGWMVPYSTGQNPIAWKIRVRNVDQRDITINRNSSLALEVNDGQSNRRAWYIEPPAIFIPYDKEDETEIVYIWSDPGATRAGDFYSGEVFCRVYLTFYGVFHEQDGGTKPYAQTIPFEAVLSIKTGTLGVYPWLTAIPTGPNISFKIMARTLDSGGKALSNQNATFTQTKGTLSKSWNLTDSNGIAMVTLQASTTDGTGKVTSEWFVPYDGITLNSYANFTSTSSLYVTTDKPIYVQGNNITINGLLKNQSNQNIEITIIDPDNNIALQRIVTSNATGYFSTSYQLPNQATVGPYTVRAKYTPQNLVAASMIIVNKR